MVEKERASSRTINDTFTHMFAQTDTYDMGRITN